MKPPRYYTVEEMLCFVDNPTGKICQKVLTENLELFQKVQGSLHNHQAWPGGYLHHIQEVMNIAILWYGPTESARPLPFSLSDVLLVLFFHDIEKPWKYEIGPDGQLQEVVSLRKKSAQHEFRAKKLAEYGIVLTEKQANAMKYVEGEGDDYTNRRRVSTPLAAFCHLADSWSARGWFNYPQEENDPWPGACRNRH